MSTPRAPYLPPLPHVHRTASVADGRRVRALGDRIFAALLSGSTARSAAAPASLRAAPASAQPRGVASARAATPSAFSLQAPIPPHRAGEEGVLSHESVSH